MTEDNEEIIASPEEVPVEDLGVEANRLEILEKENKENYDKYLRAIAELENFKKRATKERSELLKYAGESIVVDLLDVLDDLDRAVNIDPAKLGTPQEVIEGVRMIRGRFAAVLKKHSVEVKEAAGEKFDPLCHEALTTVSTKDHPPGTVMEQLRKAYVFKDKLIRTAQVVVSKEPENNEGNS